MVLTPFKSPVISQHYRDFRGVVGGLGFNPVQKSGHIPTKIVTAILAVMFCFNPVQKSGHIPTKKRKLQAGQPLLVLTPFKSPVISQQKWTRLHLPKDWVLTPFKSPVISQLVDDTVSSTLNIVLTPFKSPVISQLITGTRWETLSCFNPVQKSGHIPT